MDHRRSTGATDQQHTSPTVPAKLLPSKLETIPEIMVMVGQLPQSDKSRTAALTDEVVRNSITSPVVNRLLSGSQNDAPPAAVTSVHSEPKAGSGELAGGSSAAPTVTDQAQRLDHAIDQDEALLSSNTPDSESSSTSSRAAIANRQALMLMNRFELLGSKQDFDKAIDRMREAALAPPCRDLKRSTVLYSLANMLLRRFVERKAVGDLDHAITAAEETCGVMDAEDRDRPERFRLLSSLLQRRFQHLGTMEDLEKAIEIMEDAIASTDASHPLRATLARTLSNNLLARFQRTGNVKDLDQAIVQAKQAALATSTDDPAHEPVCDSMAVTHLMRHGRFGDGRDIEQAIHWAQEAIKDPPRNTQIRESSLGTLGAALLSRYQASWAMEDIDRAIQLGKEAITLTPHYAHAEPLNTLGGMFLARFRHTGDVGDLNQAITSNKESLSMVPVTDPARARYVENLSQLLFTSYQRFGNPTDLEQGTARATEAFTLTPFGHPARARRSSQLGSFISARYSHSSALGDINQAIELTHDAVIAVPVGDISRSRICRSLGIDLAIRYERSGNEEDLDESIKWIREALTGIPSGGNDRARAVESLATMLICRYDLRKDEQDVAEAQLVVEKAITETPADFQPRSFLDYTLGCVFERRYEVSLALEDIEQAIKWIGDAVRAMPLNDPSRSIQLYRRAEIVFSRYLRTKFSQDYYFMLHDLYEAWHSHFSRPVTRIRAAKLASNLLIEKKRWQEASCMLDNAVKLLPTISSRPFARADQEYFMSAIQGIPSNSVSVALQAGAEAAYCLRLLELGRGVIMGNAIDRRSDLSELGLRHPQSFENYHRLRMILDHPVTHSGEYAGQPGLMYEQGRKQREQVVDECEEALASIRELPGLESFQMPPRSDTLMAMANEGPIIIVNSTELRGDAIIVTTTSIRSLALPNLTYTSVKYSMSKIPKLVKGGRMTYKTRNEEMGELLLWLWNVAVEPIVEALQMGPNVPDLPRIWWIGVGLLAMAPFHAAGDHSRGSQRNTISRAISSYIPTIKALSFAREKPLKLHSDFHLLLVSMPTTPGNSALPNAALEVGKIADITLGKGRQTSLVHPTTAEVLAVLPTCHAVHFSCHGISDAKNPSNSHLLLRDGEYLDKLSVEAVAKTNIKHAQIAYLSACSTAENASAEIPDESIYIASGFQLAGFSHVLATQWISNDTACRQVASDFYDFLFQGTGGPRENDGHRRVGVAFHLAVKRLRNRNRGQPILWAPYIHTGA